VNGICVKAGTLAKATISNPNLGTTFTASTYYVVDDCNVNSKYTFPGTFAEYLASIWTWVSVTE
jgi:hypothetical protein